MRTNMKTVLITGTSSGIGLETAKYFAENGWNVAATLRNPEKDTQLKNLDNIKLYRLDVTNPETIQDAIEQAIKDFGGIDVIVNNAGYGVVGAFEAATEEQIKEQFDTNLFGAMNVIRAILPYFRKKRKGLIINVSTVGGRSTFPIYSLYHSSKWALEGFSESLQYELKPFNIKVKIVEPGPVKTEFTGRSQVVTKKAGLTDYDEFVIPIHKASVEFTKKAIGPIKTAKVIFKAANDPSDKLRYPGDFLCRALLFFRWLLPYRLFSSLISLFLRNRVDLFR